MSTEDMLSSGSTQDNYRFPGVAPSVSLEKWLHHARKKLSKGYYLVIGEKRKVANFFRGYGPLEACHYQVALKLLQQGELEEVGKHYLGKMYRLKPEFFPKPESSRKPRIEEEEEEETIDLEEALTEEEEGEEESYEEDIYEEESGEEEEWEED